jgi:hypothetical protein
MSKTILCFITLLAAIGCGSGGKSPADLNSPEALGTAYIQFINNGASFSDYKDLLPTAEETFTLTFQIEGSNKEKADKAQSQYAELMTELDKRWSQFSNPTVLSLRPYKFQALQTKKKKSEILYKDNSVIATDKDGKSHVFMLGYIANINGVWKIADPNHQQPISEY